MTQISEGHGVPHAYAIDPHKNPSTANHEDLDRLSPGYQSFEHPHLHGAEFTFHPNFELSKLDHYPAAPGQFDDDSDEDDIHDQADLQDRIREHPEHTHPLVVVQHPDRHELLDGSHRAGLALDAGVTHLPAYVHEPGHRTAKTWLPTHRVFGPTYGLDTRLFEGETLKPSIAADIVAKFSGFCRAHDYEAWPIWAKIIFFGSEASNWTSPTQEGNGDFDLSIGIDYGTFRDHNPAHDDLSDQEIADMFTQQMHAELNDPEHHYEGISGTYDQTWYANLLGWNIAVMRPYAAYDVVAGTWIVKPPNLPDWDITKFPEGKGLVDEIKGVLQMAKGILKMPEPYKTQNGAIFWHFIHDSRSDAFTENGEGWFDPRNLVEKALDQRGLLQPLWACMERAKNAPESIRSPEGWSNDPSTSR